MGLRRRVGRLRPVARVRFSHSIRTIPKFVLGGSYQGTIEVLDVNAKAGTNIMAAPIQYLGMDAKDIKYRFNWNAPIIWSKHEPNTYYHGVSVPVENKRYG